MAPDDAQPTSSAGSPRFDVFETYILQLTSILRFAFVRFHVSPWRFSCHPPHYSFNFGTFLLPFQSYGFITTLFSTSVAKLLGIPSFQLGTSKVDVWHHGLSLSSFSITWAKQPDHPLRGNALQVVAIRSGWMRLDRLYEPSISLGHHFHPFTHNPTLSGEMGLVIFVFSWHQSQEGCNGLPSIVASCTICPIIVMFPLNCNALVNTIVLKQILSVYTLWRKYPGAW